MSAIKSTNLEMLSQREQLMEDIESICESFFISNFPNSQVDKFEDLTCILCDAVCKNFPSS